MYSLPKSFIQRSAILLSAAIISSSAASAALVVQTQTYSGTPSYSSNLTFNKFNSSLGTLTSIQITTSVTSQGGAYRIDNDSPSPGSGTVTLGASVGITSSDVPLINASYQPIGSNITASNSTTLYVAADDGDGPVYSSEGPDAASFTGTDVTNSASGYVGSFVFGNYTGVGTYVISAASNQVNSSTSFSGIQTQIDPVTSNGFVTITYNYTPTPVPEPATCILMSLGATVIVAKMRRKSLF